MERERKKKQQELRKSQRRRNSLSKMKKLKKKPILQENVYLNKTVNIFCENLNSNEYLLMGWSRESHKSLKCKRYMTFPLPHPKLC